MRIGHVNPFGRGALKPEHFKPFKSKVSRPSFDAFTEDNNSIASIRFGNYNNHHSSNSKKAKAKRGSDMKTIFHNAHERLAYDPNLQFCDTPSPNLTHQSILNTLRHDGKHTVRSVVMGPDDIPFGERCGDDIKIALPDYNVNYDSKYLRPSIKLSKISKTLRFKTSEERRTDSERHPETFGSSTISNASSRGAEKKKSIDNNNNNDRGEDDDEDFIEFKFKAPKAHEEEDRRHGKKGIKMPSLKFKKKLVMEFDSSCYDRNPKQKETLNLTPQKINKEIRKNQFLSILFVPHLYKSRSIESAVNRKIRMAFEVEARDARAKANEAEEALLPRSVGTYYTRTDSLADDSVVSTNRSSVHFSH